MLRCSMLEMGIGPVVKGLVSSKLRENVVYGAQRWWSKAPILIIPAKVHSLFLSIIRL